MKGLKAYPTLAAERRPLRHEVKPDFLSDAWVDPSSPDTRLHAVFGKEGDGVREFVITGLCHV